MVIKNILFLCTGNSCRSQMAEGWGRALLPEGVMVYSAGIVAQGVNPLAVKAMAEFDIDISNQSSKTVADLTDVDFDLVVTVCDNAQQSCPIFHGAPEVIHNAFDDPPLLAKEAVSEMAAFQPYQRVCGEIRIWVMRLSERLAFGV